MQREEAVKLRKESINRNILECKYRKALSSEIASAADHSGVRYSKEDIKRRKVERKFDKRSIKKNWRLQTPVKQWQGNLQGKPPGVRPQIT